MNGICHDCGRILPVKPTHLSVTVAHVAHPDCSIGSRSFYRPCVGSLQVLIGEGLQLRNLDRDEWWDL